MPRTVYGRTHSLNGWPMVNADECEWVKIPGTNGSVSLQIQRGAPAAILRAFVADWNAYLEPVYDADSACWTPTNSVPTSDHLSGTACDVRWQSHPFQVSYAGFSQQMINTMREMLDFYEGIVFWGQDWRTPKDPMHVSLNGSAYGGPDTYNNPKVNDFIRRKIRPDGFSTFRRGSAPVPAPPASQVDVLVRATGVTAAKAQQILPVVVNGLRDSQCTNVNRIAMWLAQIGHESAGFNATEEYASGAAYEGRADLGNTQPGDGVRFKGRSWTQITGRSNYAQLSKWAYQQGLVPSPTFFVDDSTRLAEMQYASLGPAWYWTVARPQINGMCDRGDLIGVTKAINGGTNGLQDRTNRWNRAKALGDQLLALTAAQTPGDDDLSAEAERLIRDIHRELTQRHPSRSPLRHLNEGFVDTVAGFVLNADGSQHVEIVKLLASLGHPESLALLREVAGADPVKHPNRQGDAKIAQAILAEVAAPVASVSTVPAEAPDDLRRDYSQVIAENAELRAEILALRAQVSATPPPPVSTEVVTFSGSTGEQGTGQVIGELYSALEKLRLADALPIEGRAPLAALISVLQTKNGSNL